MRRSVQFWRLISEDGRDLNGPFPAEAIVRCLDRAARNNLDRHRHCRDGMVLLGHAARTKPLPSLVLDKVRHENLPSVGDAAGLRRSLGLANEEGLLEPTYCTFMENNVVAMLASGDGPRPGRLADYIRAKFGLAVGLTPVLRQDLDAVLQEMRVTSVDISIRAAHISRDLVGGDWVQALEAGRQLSQDGVVRVGFSVGRRGTREEKRHRGERFRALIDRLRGSGGLSEFQSAKVGGVVNGSSRTVDLIHDKFVQQTEVDADLLSDPERSVDYACDLLTEEIRQNRGYLVETTPVVSGAPLQFNGNFIENPDDEQA
jgi:hypothetical protein